MKAAAPALTAAQRVALLAAVTALAEADYAAVLYDDQELMVELGIAGAKAVMNLTTGFDVKPADALRLLRDRAKEFDSKINLQEKEALRDAIAQAMDEGLSVPQTRDLIKQTFSEGMHYFDEDGESVRTLPTDAWATLVARTELSNAANSGMMASYDEAGVQRIQWLCAESENSCEDCINADGEVVDLGEDFPFVDVPAPSAHPRCECTTAPADDELGDFRIGGEEQSDWSSRGGYDAESFQEKFGYQHPLDARKQKGE